MTDRVKVDELDRAELARLGWRCAGAVEVDGVLVGCDDPATVLRGASGTLANRGERFTVALCAEHDELADGAATMTLTVVHRD